MIYQIESIGKAPPLRDLPAKLTRQPVKQKMSSSSAAQRLLVEVTRRGHCLLIGLNRPEKRNCVNPQMARALFDAFNQFESDPEARVLVLHGMGGHFCSGYDLAEAAGLSGGGAKPNCHFGPVGSPGPGPMGPTRMLLTKPSVAAISGYAVAGGLELALLCDLRVVEKSAVMGVFCRRFGVPLIDGGTVRLQALIGLSRALDLTLTGRPVASDEAAQMGLANRVCPDGKALEAAVALAEEIAAFPQACTRADRVSAIAAAYDGAEGFQRRLADEFDRGVVTMMTAEAADGAAAFVRDKRGRGGKFEGLPADGKAKL